MALTSGVSIADNNGSVAATIASTTLTLVNGSASVTVTLPANAAWAAGNTVTLTAASATVLGYTVASATSVDTLAA